MKISVPEGWVVVRRLCVAVAMTVLAGCGGVLDTKNDWVITAASLSGDAAQIAMLVDRKTAELHDHQYMIIYHVPEDRFEILPDIHAGWIPQGSPEFSHDQSKIAISAYCAFGCTDLNDRSRLYVFDRDRGSWSVVVSGEGWHAQPRFLSGDRQLIHTEEDLYGSLSSGDLRPVNPVPAVTDLVTGRTIRYELGGSEFYSIIGPQLGPGPGLYFIGIFPTDARLKEDIERIAGGQPTLQLPYYVPVMPGSNQERSPRDLPVIIEKILPVAGPPEVSHLTVSGNGKRVMFATVEFSTPKGPAEKFHLLEDGVVREIIYTPIQTKDFALSADGHTALILGDPQSRGFRGGYWDFHLLDVERRKITPLPLRERVISLIEDRRATRPGAR